jgi:transcriptional regulator with PAS, ATPase and Fis domain
LSGSLTDVSRRAAAQGERLKIQQVLREADHNKGRAAELLQITYKMLLAKVKEYKLE